jgi:hypothetical protein
VLQLINYLLGFRYITDLGQSPCCQNARVLFPLLSVQSFISSLASGVRYKYGITEGKISGERMKESVGDAQQSI